MMDNAQSLQTRFHVMAKPIGQSVIWTVPYKQGEVNENNNEKKVYEIDPLICPQCGGRMTIISFIEDHKVIDKIIDHLKLTFIAERP